MWALHVRTYELDERNEWAPVLEHIFFGKTQREALHNSYSHSKTDTFYRDCGFYNAAHPQNWRGITCYSEEWWTRE